MPGLIPRLALEWLSTCSSGNQGLGRSGGIRVKLYEHQTLKKVRQSGGARGLATIGPSDWTQHIYSKAESQSIWAWKDAASELSILRISPPACLAIYVALTALGSHEYMFRRIAEAVLANCGESWWWRWQNVSRWEIFDMRLKMYVETEDAKDHCARKCNGMYARETRIDCLRVGICIHPSTDNRRIVWVALLEALHGEFYRARLMICSWSPNNKGWSLSARGSRR